MAEFTPITTQEQFDAAIQARIARERTTIEGKYSDYESLKTQVQTLSTDKTSLEQKVAGFQTEKTNLQKQIDDANKKVKDLETDALKTEAAIAKGLPLELRSRLAGSTKEEIEADADKLVKVVGKGAGLNLPGFNPGSGNGGNEGSADNKIDQAYKEMLNGLDLDS